MRVLLKMKKTVFIIIVCFVLSGCGGPEKGFKVKVRSDENVPLKVALEVNQRLPVEVKSLSCAKELPVKLNVPEDEPLPVKLVIEELSNVVLGVSVASAVIAAFSAICAWRAVRNIGAKGTLRRHTDETTRN